MNWARWHVCFKIEVFADWQISFSESRDNLIANKRTALCALFLKCSFACTHILQTGSIPVWQEFSFLRNSKLCKLKHHRWFVEWKINQEIVMTFHPRSYRLFYLFRSFLSFNPAKSSSLPYHHNCAFLYQQKHSQCSRTSIQLPSSVTSEYAGPLNCNLTR